MYIQVSATLLVLFLFRAVNVQTKASDETDENTSEDNDRNQSDSKPASINETRLNFCYWNSYLGNDNPVKIAVSNESKILNYWIDNLPLKVITHGWMVSGENHPGIFIIKTAYVDVGGFNVITVDWSSFADDIDYLKPAILTKSIGYAIAKFLDRLVKITVINASEIHLIGHSLGAHVMGICGFYFRNGTIGRITGLDPASPGFEFNPIDMKHLNKDDAKFVDVIHTTGWNIGFSRCLGHADFFPNGGIAPQPGCFSLLNFLKMLHCSHARAHDLYADSVYYRKSLIAVECSSWILYGLNECNNNTKAIMGHGADLSTRGKFFLETEDSSPYGSF